MKSSVITLVILGFLSATNSDKELYKEYYDCQDYEICESLKLYKDGTFKYKHRTMIGDYIDKGAWLIVKNRLTLKSNQKTKPWWKKRKKLLFKNEHLLVEGKKLTFTKPKKKTIHALIQKESKETVEVKDKRNIIKSYTRNDFHVFVTLNLYQTGEFEFLEWTHTNQYTMDFGTWTENKTNKTLNLKSKNTKFGIFENAKFKVDDQSISNLNEKKYHGFFSILAEEK